MTIEEIEELQKAIPVAPSKVVRIAPTAEDEYMNLPSTLRNLDLEEDGGDEAIE